MPVRTGPLSLIVVVGWLGLGAPGVVGQEPVHFELVTREGVSIPATALTSRDTGESTWVLLFHQDGASRAEYATIAPRLHGIGLNVLMIDQRRGGDLFGGVNAIAASFDQEATSYCEVMVDLGAALDHVRSLDPAAPVILWGSSYTAALVVRLAAERPGDVAGVLAFSPASGEVMEGCRPEPVLDDVHVPLLAVRPASEMEYPWIAEQLEAFAAAGHRTWIANPGRHGSSTLVADRVGSETGETWAVVEAFLRSLRGVAPRPPA